MIDSLDFRGPRFLRVGDDMFDVALAPFVIKDEHETLICETPRNNPGVQETNSGG